MSRARRRTRRALRAGRCVGRLAEQRARQLFSPRWRRSGGAPARHGRPFARSRDEILYSELRQPAGVTDAVRLSPAERPGVGWAAALAPPAPPAPLAPAAPPAPPASPAPAAPPALTTLPFAAPPATADDTR